MDHEAHGGVVTAFWYWQSDAVKHLPKCMCHVMPAVLRPRMPGERWAERLQWADYLAHSRMNHCLGKTKGVFQVSLTLELLGESPLSLIYVHFIRKSTICSAPYTVPYPARHLSSGSTASD